MRAIAVGFSVKGDQLPGRGERVSDYVSDYMTREGVGVGELAFKARVDKRDLRRLINEKTCGHRLEDDLAAFFGWGFVEKVMTPVVGADPVTAMERDLERKLAEAAALHARVEREKQAREGAPQVASGLRVVGRAVVVRPPSLGGGA